MRTIFTRAQNIRSIGTTAVEFTPAVTGITAVTGANGSGKTTLTTLVPLIAAWGDAKTVGGTLGELIAEGAKTGKATWSFEQGGHIYEVTRTLTRTATGASSKVSILVDGSGEQTKGMRANDCAKFLTDVLGMGPEEFLSTSLIAQGEISNLTSATPAVVRDQIRRTLGLDRAIRAADRLEREIKPERDALPEAPDAATVKRARAAAIDAASAESEARSAAELAEAEATKAAEKAASARALATTANDNYQTWRGAAGSLTEAKHRLDAAQQTCVEAAALVETAAGRAGYAPVGKLPEITDVEHRFRQIMEQHTAANAATLRLHELESAMLGNPKTAQESVSVAEHAFQDAQHAVAQFGDIAELTAKEAAAVARAEDLADSAVALDGQGSCPTCHTALADSTTLANSLRKQAAQEREIAEKYRSQANTREKLLQQAEAILTSTETALQQAQLEHTTALAAQNELEAARRVVGETLGEGTLDQLNDALSRFRELGTAMAQHQQAVFAVEKEQARVTELSGTADQDGDGLHTKVLDAENEATAAEQEAGHAAEKRAATAATHAAAVAEWRRLDASIAQLTAAVDAREKAEERIGTKLHAAKILREFATAYTTEKVSVIEDSVNALLRGVSTGFLRFSLGADFSPAVQVGDVWRPTHELSGGESAIVGLLLRIGIVAAVTGGELDVTLTADEPLANLDAQARWQVSQMLSQLPCPVTIISHSAEPAEAAALRVEVKRDPATGFTMLEAA